MQVLIEMKQYTKSQGTEPCFNKLYLLSLYRNLKPQTHENIRPGLLSKGDRSFFKRLFK